MSMSGVIRFASPKSKTYVLPKPNQLVFDCTSGSTDQRKTQSKLFELV